MVPATPAGVPAAVANGQASLSVFRTRVLAACGIEMAGSSPPKCQQDLVCLYARAAGGSGPGPASAPLAYLRLAEAQAVPHGKGWRRWAARTFQQMR